MKNFYEIDSQIVEIEGEIKQIQAKVEGVIWIKYIAIAVGMGIAGWLILMLPAGLIFIIIDWLVNLVGGDIRNGPGTVVSWIGNILGWIGFLSGVGLAISWGIAGGNELGKRVAQLSGMIDDLRAKRSDYLRNSTD